MLAVGGAEVMGLRGPRTRVFAWTARPCCPGFNDAHAHVVYYGLTRFGADLGRRAQRRRDRRAAARARAASEAGRTGSRAWAYRADELAERRQPHRRELDRATGTAPRVHRRARRPLARRQLGGPGGGGNHRLDARTPMAGRIGRDPDGTPNGLLLESAMRLVADVQPPPDRSAPEPRPSSWPRSCSCRAASPRWAPPSTAASPTTCVLRAARRGRPADDARQRVPVVGAARGRRRTWRARRLRRSLVRAGPIKVFVDGGAERVAMRSGGGVWRTHARGAERAGEAAPRRRGSRSPPTPSATPPSRRCATRSRLRAASHCVIASSTARSARPTSGAASRACAWSPSCSRWRRASHELRRGLFPVREPRRPGAHAALAARRRARRVQLRPAGQRQIRIHGRASGSRSRTR